MKWDNQQTKELLAVILSLQTADEARRFFRDLLTEDELIEFGKRWRAARLLDRGISYNTIVRRTGLSTRTIARISGWLARGMGGYRLAIHRLNHHHSSLRLQR